MISCKSFLKRYPRHHINRIKDVTTKSVTSTSISTATMMNPLRLSASVPASIATQHHYFSSNSSSKKKESPIVHVHVHQTSAQPATPSQPAKPATPVPTITKTKAAPSPTSKPAPSSTSTSTKPDPSKLRPIVSPFAPKKVEEDHSESKYSITDIDHQTNMTTVQTRDYEYSYLPGILLSKSDPTSQSTSTSQKSESVTNAENRNENVNEMQIDMQKFYFALRAFHIEIASIRTNENEGPDSGLGFSSGNNLALMRMRWWKESLNYLYDEDNNDNDNNNDDITKTKTNTPVHGGGCGGGCATKKKKSRASSGNVGNNPTIRSLKHVIRTQKLSRHLLETMIDARVHDLQRKDDDRSTNDNDDNFDSMEDMIDFYSKTVSSLLLLHLECCGVSLFNNSVSGNGSGNSDSDSSVHTQNEVEKMKEVVNCIGIGIGITNAIRSINTGQIGIPNDLILKYKINTNVINDPRSIIANNNEDGRLAIQNAVREMSNQAKEYLYHARLHQSIIPKGDARVSLLSVVSSLRYIEKLDALDYDIFHESVRDVENVESLNGRLWRLGGMFYLWRAWLTGIF
jgi:hypothetical protein